MARAGQFPRWAVVLYVVGFVPTALRPILPAPVVSLGFLLGSAAIVWLSVTLVPRRGENRATAVSPASDPEHHRVAAEGLGQRRARPRRQRGHRQHRRAEQPAEPPVVRRAPPVGDRGCLQQREHASGHADQHGRGDEQDGRAGSAASNAMLAAPAPSTMAVLVRTLVAADRRRYPIRPHSCPIPPRPNASAAVPVDSPRSISSGTWMITTP